MVTIDPCERLKIIQTQLVPAILTSATYDVDTLDIKVAIEKNLPDLERNCYELLGRCEKKWPDCRNEIELCSSEKIKELFRETREKLEKIWEEKEKRAGKESEGT
ncbi:MAG: hypothetical protein O8C62_06585 [Candidatus Methanoperedens sp.]|nr:hypothetical protein [Candidatus Methanoperedens sp.]